MSHWTCHHGKVGVQPQAPQQEDRKGWPEVSKGCKDAELQADTSSCPGTGEGCNDQEPPPGEGK